MAYLLGWEECLICGAEIEGGVVTDGTYIWPGELAHYVGGHSVRLPRLFVAHVQAGEFASLSSGRLFAIEELILSGDVDRQWWTQTSPGD